MTDLKSMLADLRQQAKEVQAQISEHNKEAKSEFMASIISDFKATDSVVICWEVKDEKDKTKKVAKQETYPSFKGESGIVYAIQKTGRVVPVEEVNGKLTWA